MEAALVVHFRPGQGLNNVEVKQKEKDFSPYFQDECTQGECGLSLALNCRAAPDPSLLHPILPWRRNEMRNLQPAMSFLLQKRRCKNFLSKNRFGDV